mmetsp:Transcript_2073/g.3676  ORF Transcript_2073/g.3676 Transcript_2073/m.3676 type:complete len:949 (-) Transcript_2073:159-3005(-)
MTIHGLQQLLLLLVSLLGVTVVISATEDHTNNQQTQRQEEIPSNPYYSGCLYHYYSQQQEDENVTQYYVRPRVCNSNDPPSFQDNDSNNDDNHNQNTSTSNTTLVVGCRPPEFPYLEIRVASGNWDSATMLGWLTQIVLSELVGVPSTMESGMYGSSRDFYDVHGAIDYDTGISDQPLITASELPDGDCRSIPKLPGEEYIPCAHFMPEFWGEPETSITDQKVEPAQSTGFLGHETWYVTKFTAHEYPQLVSYHGLQKQENRELLASTFRRPTTWKQYCEEVSVNNCTTPDETALRAPRNEYEAEKMFAKVKDIVVLDDDENENEEYYNHKDVIVYGGHFRYTDKNNCTLWPTNCTGHIANYPCGWRSNMETQLYYLNISLDSNNGPNGGPNGYTESQLKEMWHAANHTKSHLMMQWWQPEPLYQEFLDTDAEMQRVTLKPYTRECSIARSYWKDECSDDFATRVGSPEEACGDPVEPLRKLINVGLYEVLNAPDIPEEALSPAYDVLRFFSISEIQLGELFDLWKSEPTPRDAVCKWAVENLDTVLKTMIPPTYPRVIKEESASSFGLASMIVALIATLIVVLTGGLVYRNRQLPAIRYAQPDFLFLLLVGSFFVGLGATLLSAPASDGTCLSSLWFINVGYTLEIFPLILKVAAINRMMEAARELRRVTIRRSVLYNTVAAVTLLVIVYLACWSAINPPSQTSEYSMTDEVINEEVIVGRSYYCSNSSDSNVWSFVAVAWNAALLLAASVLAFQTRNVIQAFNESRTLAFLIYSHFIFVMARISIIFLSDHVQGSILNFSMSLVYSIDQVAACCIYFFPKLLVTQNGETSSDGFSGDISSYFGIGRRFSTGMIEGISTRQRSILNRFRSHPPCSPKNSSENGVAQHSGQELTSEISRTSDNAGASGSGPMLNVPSSGELHIEKSSAKPSSKRLESIRDSETVDAYG